MRKKLTAHVSIAFILFTVFFVYAATRVQAAPEGMALIPAGESTKAFYLDKYEVTQKAYQKEMSGNPSRFRNPDNPVERVTWDEANAYCQKVGKRLPTEWEWERAAKGENNTAYPGGDEIKSGQANFCDAECEFYWKKSEFNDGFKHAAPVGKFPAGDYGLHDMEGNVSEWTSSRERGSSNVLRGGSWNNAPSVARADSRDWNDPTTRSSTYGFRCAASS